MRLLTFCILALCCLAPKAFAGPLETAKEAYDLEDYQTALKILQPLAAEGDGAAQELLGEMYFHGAGVTKDQNTADKWLSAAAETYRNEATHGDAEAQVRLGSMYARWNWGVKHDAAEAMKLFQEAARQGNREAQYQISLLYFWGNGVKKSAADALIWAKTAADGGYTPAMIMMGQSYENGCCGIKQDYPEALKWYRMAADQGNVAAIFQIGEMYWFGQGVELNCATAIKWWQKAADGGDPSAQGAMGDLYRNGECGIKQNFVEAYFWHSLPGGRTSDPTAAKGDVQHLSPEQVEAVQKRVARWRPTPGSESK